MMLRISLSPTLSRLRVLLGLQPLTTTAYPLQVQRAHHKAGNPLSSKLDVELTQGANVKGINP